MAKITTKRARKPAKFYNDFSIANGDEIPPESKPPENRIYYAWDVINGIPTESNRLALDGFELQPLELLETILDTPANDANLVWRDPYGSWYTIDLDSGMWSQIRSGYKFKRLPARVDRVGDFLAINAGESHYVFTLRDVRTLAFCETAAIALSLAQILDEASYREEGNRGLSSYEYDPRLTPVIQRGSFDIVRDEPANLGVVTYKRNHVFSCDLVDSAYVHRGANRAVIIVDELIKAGYDPATSKRVYKRSTPQKPKRYKSQSEIDDEAWLRSVDKAIHAV